jgi:hypothetical protein
VAALRRQAALQEKVSPLLLRMLEKTYGEGGTTPGVLPSASAMPPPSPAPASYAPPPPVPNPPAPPGAVPSGPPAPMSGPAMPPPPSVGPSMGTGYTGLLGGSPQMAGLPPQDELIPSEGIFDAIQASYGRGGTGMPGLPFRAGADTGAAPTLRLASDARPTAGLTGSAWEIANNNFGGLRRPGVVAGPSQGGFQSFETPEQGLAAISRQLDRYATGATTGRPLTTIREIVSTWAPPHENPTAALIARASRIVGADPDAPLDVSNPQIKAKLIEATIANEQGGRVPVDRELINSVASQPPGDQVIYSGRGVPPDMLQTVQARTGGPAGAAGPFMPAMPDFRNLPRGSGGGLGDPLPGLGVSPKELMAIDALSEMAKMGNPFKGFLEGYYKTPGYLEGAAAATARGTLPFDIFKQQVGQRSQYGYDLLKDMAKDNMTLDEQGNIVPLPEARRQRTMNADEIARVQEEWKARFAPTEADVVGPDGKTIVKQRMTQWELQRREEAQRQRGAGGMTGAPRPGDIAGTRQFDPEQLEGQKLDYAMLEEKRKAAEAAVKEINQANDMRRSIEQGVVAGAGADKRTQLLKFGQLLGLTGKNDNELIANTEKYITQQGNNMKEALKGLGPPVSNVDIQIATQIGGGQNTTVEGMQKLLEIKEKYQRLALRDYNKIVPLAPPSRFRTTLPEPPKFGATIAASPDGTSRVWWDAEDKQWKPAP